MRRDKRAIFPVEIFPAETKTRSASQTQIRGYAVLRDERISTVSLVGANNVPTESSALAIKYWCARRED